MDFTVEGFPLAPQQRKLWRSQAEDGFHYLCEASIRAVAPLNPAYLREALRGTVLTHEVLRARYQLVPGLAVPLQVIEPSADVVLSGDENPGALNFERGPLVCFSLATAGDLFPSPAPRCPLTAARCAIWRTRSRRRTKLCKVGTSWIPNRCNMYSFPSGKTKFSPPKQRCRKAILAAAE